MHPPDTPEGHAARIVNLERVVETNSGRLRSIEQLQAREEERHKNMMEDMAELKEGIRGCAENCQAIRNWVRSEMEKERKAQEAENIEKRKLKTSEKIAIWTVSGGLLTAIIAAVAAIVTASHT